MIITLFAGLLPFLTVTTPVEAYIAPEAPKVAYTTREDVKRLIRQLAIRYDVDQDLALRIACAESNLKPTAKNSHSSAEGVYQFLDGTWEYYGMKYWKTLEGKDKLDAEDNVELAMIVLSKIGTSDWNESKNVWLYKTCV